MNKPIPLLTVVATLVLLGSTNQSNAQRSVGFSRTIGYQATGDDGITASPKMRQFLNERGDTMDRTTSTAIPVFGTVGYQPVGGDGIAASPKMRQMLNERAEGEAQIAPLK